MRLLKQARRCEQAPHRLELLNMHADDEKAEKYIMLNQRVLKKIEQMPESKLEWDTDIKVRLGRGTRILTGHVMVIPWMKRMAANYHDRSKVEKKKAMG